MIMDTREMLTALTVSLMISLTLILGRAAAWSFRRFERSVPLSLIRCDVVLTESPLLPVQDQFSPFTKLP